MNLDEEDVRQALHGLEDKGLAGAARSDGRVAKYEHRLGEAFNFTRAETALLCVLLLRGPQTPGELRGRSERLHGFEELADVLSGLQRLMDREPSLAAILPRQPGTKEARFAHLLCGPVESIAIPAAEPVSGHFAAAVASMDQERIERIEAGLEELRQQMAALNQKIDNIFG